MLSQSTYQYSIVVLPENATNKTIEWDVITTTNNPDSIENITGNASITQSGLLTPLAEGLIKVIAKSIDGSNITSDLDVTITSSPILVESIAFGEDNPTTIYLNVE